jgi:hypothetical protein
MFRKSFVMATMLMVFSLMFAGPVKGPQKSPGYGPINSPPFLFHSPTLVNPFIL